MRRILDCTLRDGAHVNSGMFGFENSQKIIKDLYDSNIDIIEVGFVKNSGNFSRDSSFYSSFEEIDSIVPEEIVKTKKSLISAMVRVEELDTDKIIKSKSVDIIRFAFYPEDKALVPEKVRKARNQGFFVYLNPLASSTITLEDFRELIIFCNSLDVDGVSIVDTFGSLNLKNISTMFRIMMEILSNDKEICLHLHENLSLARGMIEYILNFENSNLRNIIIDGSLMGMGRIPGNIPVELIVMLLEQSCGKYKLEPLLNSIQNVILKEKEKRSWGYSPEYAISAEFGIHRSYPEFFVEQHGATFEQSYKMMKYVLYNNKGERFDPNFAKEALRKFKRKTYAVIPVKGNSSRLPGKNILPFGKSTLLETKIWQLQQVKGIDEIIVSSDSDVMLEKASAMGVRAIKRPEDLANETRPLSEFFEYICDIINDPEGILVWACCTSPLFDEKHLNRAYELYNSEVLNSSKYDSLITVYKHKHYMRDENGPLNYKLGRGHTNSQDIAPWYLFTNGVIISRLNNVREWGYNYGPNPYSMEVGQKASIDIDTREDYICACALYNH